ncbi:MAG: tyrosine-type recombinase/integrase [Clostridia bacterium]|nr:tyrosine-type recombinase/integrase [Clostridia bacterium]
MATGDKNSYFEKRKINCIERADLVIDELPPFCREFFIGIENNTSALTRLNYAIDLRIFFDFVIKKIFKGKKVCDLKLDDLEKISSSDIERYLSYLNNYTHDGKNLSCNERAKQRKLASVRAMYKYFFNKEKIVANTAAKVQTPKIHDKEIIRLEVNEVVDMINTVETGDGLSARQKAYHENTKIRDTAIITLFLGTGIRISELVGLNIDDIFMDSNSFVITRKGGNRTILYFTDEVKNALLEWIEYRAQIKELDKDEKALFLSLRNRRISVRNVQILVEKYAKVVTPLKKITPHKLRSTFGTNLYQETGDIYVVADFLGHRDINTTKKHYAAMSDDLRRSAIKKVKLRDEE